MMLVSSINMGAQWLSGRVLDSRLRGRGFEPHRHHCVVSLCNDINPSLGLAQPRKTRPFITERFLMGRKESNQTNKQKSSFKYSVQNDSLTKSPSVSTIAQLSWMCGQEVADFNSTVVTVLCP